MGLRYHGNARSISLSPAVSWGHTPPGHARLCLHALLLAMPGRTGALGWGRGGTGSQAFRAAPFIPTTTDNIAARVCNYLQLTPPRAGAARVPQGQSGHGGSITQQGDRGTPGLEDPLKPC